MGIKIIKRSGVPRGIQIIIMYEITSVGKGSKRY